MLTTLLIIFWCLVFTYLLAEIFFYVLVFKTETAEYLQFSFKPLPSLLLVPPCMVVLFRFLNLSILFPPLIADDFERTILFSIFPGVFLSLCSGFVSNLLMQIQDQFRFWSHKPVRKLILATGQSEYRNLRTMILPFAFVGALKNSFSWLMTELFVIEVLFATSGLCSKIWALAKARDFSQLNLYLGLFMGVYGLIWVFLWAGFRRLGKRFDGYI